MNKDIIEKTFNGNFLKKCPGTPNYLCCNYYVLNIQTNCSLNCHYCILQDYLAAKEITVFSNISDALDQVAATLDNNPSRFYRIGTGELTDSLSLDHITKHSLALIPFFGRFKNTLLELKTKTNNIANLLKLNPPGNIVIAWSINPQAIINLYERKTASLEKRLRAAEQCSQKGYRIAFHLDPVILHSNWEINYKNLINRIFYYVPSRNIVWISIAGFRYTSSLQANIRERFPGSRLFLAETVKANDGKYRYLRPVRAGIYKNLVSWIKEYDANIPIYLCMESPAVWRDVFGQLPEQISNLNGIFGNSWWAG